MRTTVKSEDAPIYAASATAHEEAIIEHAISILRARVCNGEKLGGPSDVKRYLTVTTTREGVEQFRVLWLDAGHRIIDLEVVSTGTLTQASVYPREVVKSALAKNAAACIITHNHPSGSIEPSRADEALTKHLKDALALIDVRLLDHIITSGGDAMSFAEKGLM